MEAVQARLEAVFQEVFSDPELKIQPKTTSRDVAGWDSLMHVNLIVNVERAFGIRFTSVEVAGLQNVGELTHLINKRMTLKKCA